MNKEELREIVIKKWKAGEKAFYLDIVALIDQLDEPEKPVIPQFVADWIEKCKTKGKTLDRAYSDFTVEDINVIKWLYHEGDRNEKVNLFARAWLDGYTIEEKKYQVSSKMADTGGVWFLYKKNDGNIEIGTNRDYFRCGRDGTKLTEKEIKDYDPKYWAFRKPVEELE